MAYQSTSGSDEVLKRGFALFWSLLLTTSVSACPTSDVKLAGKKGLK
jgi:hypothetical protein